MKANIYIKVVLIIALLCSLSCSKSGRRKVSDSENIDRKIVVAPGNKTVVKIQKVNEGYEIPTEINGVPMHFIFDTGAGMISISETEASFLFKQGKLALEDILGKANFSDANGDISRGTVINLGIECWKIFGHQ